MGGRRAGPSEADGERELWMPRTQKGHPDDVSDENRAFCAPDRTWVQVAAAVGRASREGKISNRDRETHRAGNLSPAVEAKRCIFRHQKHVQAP